MRGLEIAGVGVRKVDADDVPFVCVVAKRDTGGL
jgi:hypothetical protein